jgi:hypothetical protein
VTAAVKRNGDAIRFASARLMTERSLILEAVREKGSALMHAKAWASDKEIMLEAWRRQVIDDPSISIADMRPELLLNVKEAGILSLMPPRLAKDRAFLLELVKINGAALEYADPSSKEDRELVLQAIATNPEALAHAADSLRADIEIVRAAISKNPRTLGLAAKELRADHGLIEAAIEKDARAIRLAAESVRADLAFLAQLANKNLLVLDELDGEVRAKVFEVAPDLRDRRAALAKELAALGIERLDRFHDELVLRQVIAERKNPVADGRPLAVLVYARADETGAFKHTQIDELQKTHRVLYFEAGKDDELIRAIAEGTGAQKADLLIIAGHGARGELALGAADPRLHAKEREELYLDLGDHQKLKELELASRIADGGHVLLRSCSTGSGEDLHPNLARLFAELAPNAHVWAPREPVNNQMLIVDGKFVDPGFSGHRSVVFHLEAARAGDV